MRVETKTLRIQCLTCKSTGLERIGGSQTAVECYTCKGSGAIDYAYTPFLGRVDTEHVSHVFPYTGYVVTPATPIPQGIPYATWQSMPLGEANLLDKSDAETKADLLKMKGVFPSSISLRLGTIPLKSVCYSCDGTGLVSGSMECDGAAVPCILCLGTGGVEVSYTAFDKRQAMGNITHVFPYTAIAGFRRYQRTRATGTPYHVWQERGCCKGDEPRDIACPVEIYDRDVLLFGETAMKADTDWCLQVQPGSQRWGRSITRCPAYPFKTACWQAFDASDDTDREAVMTSLQTELKIARRHQGVDNG